MSKHVDSGKESQDTGFSLCDRIFIKNLHLKMYIGVSEQEKQAAQNIIVNLELEVAPNTEWHEDDIQNVISYEEIKNGIQELSEIKTFSLLETFCEYIARYCLDYDRCQKVRIICEKPDIFNETDSVGVEIIRYQENP